jgi:hypothetical protein
VNEEMIVLVRNGEEFRCPYCGRRYRLHDDGSTNVVQILDESACWHVHLGALPRSNLWEVYFSRR